MSPSSQGTYRNNALNQRSHKLAAGRETRFVHGPGGELLFERSSPASTYSDKAYVWFDGQVVALVSNNTVFSVYSDHLGRPVQVRTTGNVLVWGATLQAFDRTATTDQIGGFHIGYPGQYFDAESGLWNNWHRYYDGSVGRYTQSDPIGLAGGMNTYAYVGGNPVSRSDSLGLLYVAIRVELSNTFLVFHREDGVKFPLPTFVGLYNITDAPCTFLCFISDKQWKESMDKAKEKDLSSCGAKN